MKRLMITGMIIVFIASIAYGAVIKTWEAHDIQVTNVSIVRHGENVDITAGYYFTNETGEIVAGVNIGRFSKTTLKIADLPSDLKQAVLVLQSYVKQQILDGLSKD